MSLGSGWNLEIDKRLQEYPHTLIQKMRRFLTSRFVNYDNAIKIVESAQLLIDKTFSNKDFAWNIPGVHYPDDIFYRIKEIIATTAILHFKNNRETISSQERALTCLTPKEFIDYCPDPQN